MKLPTCPGIERLRRGKQRLLADFERFLDESAAAGIEPERIEFLRRNMQETTRRAYADETRDEVFQWLKRQARCTPRRRKDAS